MTKPKLPPKAQAALQAVRDMPEAPESTLDICPPGGLTLGGYPARRLSAADMRIIHIVINSADNVDDVEAMQVLVFGLLETNPKRLWRLSRTPEKLREAVWDWCFGLSAENFARMSIDAKECWEEFLAASELIAGGDGTEAKKKTG